MNDNIHQLVPRNGNTQKQAPQSGLCLGYKTAHDHVIRGIHLLQRSRHQPESDAVAFVVEATNASRLAETKIQPVSDKIITMLPMAALARAVVILCETGYWEESDAISDLVAAALGSPPEAELIAFEPR